MVDEARLQGEEPAPAAPAALPRKPGSHTWREFVFQLATITAGVLIALSVDGVVEWRRERALVREAQAAIRQEVTANFRDLEEILPGMEAHQRDLAQALRFADQLIKTGKTDVHELRVRGGHRELESRELADCRSYRRAGLDGRHRPSPQARQPARGRLQAARPLTGRPGPAR